MKQFIECPNCSQKIDVEDALSDKLDVHYKEVFAEKEKTLLAQFDSEKKAVEAQIRESLRVQLSAEIKAEQEETLRTLKEKEALINEFRKKKRTNPKKRCNRDSIGKTYL